MVTPVEAGKAIVGKRSGRLALGTALCALTVAVAPPLGFVHAPEAAAAPVQTADQLLARYQKLSQQAEQSAEAMHNAQIEYDKQRRIVADSKRASADAQQSLTASEKSLATLQQRFDAVVRASYMGRRTNDMYAVLTSDSPQTLLDQMSGLELVARRSAADLNELKTVRAQTVAKRTAADEAAARATQAVSDAERVRGDLQKQRVELQLQAAQIRVIYSSMTGKQLAALAGPKFDFDPRAVPRGTAPALVAVQAALTRIGDPYVWGATGPDSFDCSGLMVWAFKQAGKTLPRSSEAQNAAGTPVDRNNLQPGDLIIYYPDAHHVGMYVGEGYVIHASTFGVPVKVVPLDDAGPFSAARRY
ncbi:NlpC/P60 family protein [Gordonia desulfuricans]|uniref:NlpC/P60 family protein n=1 Tax=Gordonia desulfuricans TaxID=89051 RepID=A0A7K3LN53_9ACTN|nr:NlpC/P60 family protein [Gordonia desulfuricans]NDK89672.1 NlpC/P60 family protein [Gordonia desulfuricans]